MKATLTRILLLFVLAQCSLVTKGAALQTPENTALLLPAATVAAGGIPGSTNLAGSEFMMSASGPRNFTRGQRVAHQHPAVGEPFHEQCDQPPERGQRHGGSSRRQRRRDRLFLRPHERF